MVEFYCFHISLHVCVNIIENDINETLEDFDFSSRCYPYVVTFAGISVYRRTRK